MQEQDFLLEVNMELIKAAKAVFFSTAKGVTDMKIIFSLILSGTAIWMLSVFIYMAILSLCIDYYLEDE